MMVSDKKSVNINGSVSGIVNLGNNNVNINEKLKNTNIQLESNYIEQSEISNNNPIVSKKETARDKVVKIVIEVVVGIIVSVIAGAILYKLNMI